MDKFVQAVLDMLISEGIPLEDIESVEREELEMTFEIKGAGWRGTRKFLLLLERIESEDSDGQPSESQENQDFAQDGDFENMSASDML